jgi:hypothetical protein
MKVGVYQTDPVLLDVKTNLASTIEKIEAAKAQGVDLVVFPELSLTGYFVRERYHEAALRMDSPEIRQLAGATKGTAAVVGFIEESQAMNFYNSALVAVDGEILFAYRKLNLPNYGVFEERKIFSGGKHVRVFKLKGLTIAPFTRFHSELRPERIGRLLEVEALELPVLVLVAVEGDRRRQVVAALQAGADLLARGGRSLGDGSPARRPECQHQQDRLAGHHPEPLGQARLDRQGVEGQQQGHDRTGQRVPVVAGPAVVPGGRAAGDSGVGDAPGHQ